MNRLYYSVWNLVVQNISEDEWSSGDEQDTINKSVVKNNELWVQNKANKVHTTAEYKKVKWKAYQWNTEREFLVTEYAESQAQSSTYATVKNLHLNLNEKLIQMMWFLDDNEKRNLLRVRLLEKHLFELRDMNITSQGYEKIEKLPFWMFKLRSLKLLESVGIYINQEVKFNTRKYGLIKQTLKYQAPVYEVYSWYNDKKIKGWKQQYVDYYQNWRNVNINMSNYGLMVGKTHKGKWSKPLRVDEKKIFYEIIGSKESPPKQFLEELINEMSSKWFTPLWLKNVINILNQEGDLVIHEK